MNSIKALVSRHSTLITIVTMVVVIVAIMVAGGAPVCYAP